MIRTDFIPKPPASGGPAHGLRAFVASCVFHGVLLGSIVGLSLFYRLHLAPIKSGSAPGASVISLETMVITSPPPQPAPPGPTPPISQTRATISPPTSYQLVALPKLPEEGVPVLAIPPRKPTLSKPTEAQAAVHPAISHSIATVMPSSRPPTSAASCSSYAPGLNALPHPPYPVEASDLRETGVVVMRVHFDGRGDVAQAEVAQSSGVPILDSETRSFIRAHWHSVTYAGQTISQPVEYSLENL